MSNNNKIIYLLHEGLPPTIIESQVLNHVQAMNKSHLNIEVWTFASTQKSFKEAKSRVHILHQKGLPLRLFRGVRPALPFSGVLNAILLFIVMLRWGKGVRIVHARTELSTSIASLTKGCFQFKLIWDARGDAFVEAEWQAKSWPWHKKILSRYKLSSIRRRLIMSRKKSDYSIFVSEELRQTLAPEYPEDRSCIIPCCADSEQFYFDPKLRQKKRLVLGLSEEDVVIVYCGSLSMWQCFKETVALLCPLLEANTHLKFIILTPSLEEAMAYIPQSVINQVIGKSVGLGEVNAFLNAADVAIFLREENNINYVASPVKHAEYCMAGLPIIMTRAVRSSVRISEQLGNGLWQSNPLQVPEKLSDTERSQLSKRAAEILSRKKVNSIYLNIYNGLNK